MFDNMENHPIIGTTDWKKCDVVLDVPGDTTFISIGVLLNGVGSVWLRDAQFDEVDGDVPMTGAPIKKRWMQQRPLMLQPSWWAEMRPSQPMNLDFPKLGCRQNFSNLRWIDRRGHVAIDDLKFPAGGLVRDGGRQLCRYRGGPGCGSLRCNPFHQYTRALSLPRRCRNDSHH
jgi:hypothetical protein